MTLVIIVLSLVCVVFFYAIGAEDAADLVEGLGHPTERNQGQSQDQCPLQN